MRFAARLWDSPARWSAFVALAIPAAVLADTALVLSRGEQWLLALPAWLILVGAAGRLSSRERLVLVCFLPLITVTELLFVDELRWYGYRLEGIPPWVTPAHGIVFLTGMRLLHSVRPRTSALAIGAAAAQIAYGTAALALAGDAVGFLLSLLFVAGMAVLPDPGRRFYAGIGLVVAYLELVGTALGAWRWGPELLGLGEMNPPSGAVAGYALVDGAAFLVAAFLLAWVQVVSRRTPRPSQ